MIDAHFPIRKNEEFRPKMKIVLFPHLEQMKVVLRICSSWSINPSFLSPAFRHIEHSNIFYSYNLKDS